MTRPTLYNEMVAIIGLIIGKRRYDLSLKINSRLGPSDSEEYEYVLEIFVKFSHVVDVERHCQKKVSL